MLKSLKLTDAILVQLERVERVSALYPNEDDGIAPLEREKLMLVDVILAAVTEQRQEHAAKLQRLPARAPVVPVVEVRLTRRRRGA